MKFIYASEIVLSSGGEEVVWKSREPDEDDFEWEMDIEDTLCAYQRNEDPWLAYNCPWGIDYACIYPIVSYQLSCFPYSRFYLTTLGLARFRQTPLFQGVYAAWCHVQAILRIPVFPTFGYSQHEWHVFRIAVEHFGYWPKNVERIGPPRHCWRRVLIREIMGRIPEQFPGIAALDAFPCRCFSAWGSKDWRFRVAILFTHRPRKVAALMCR